MKSKMRTVKPGVILRTSANGFKSVRYFCMVNRQRYTKTSKLPADVLVDPKTGRPTRFLNEEYGRFCAECADKAGDHSAYFRRKPTVGELVKVYEEIAWKRNADPNFRKPGERAIEAAVKNYGYCVEASGIGLDRPYDEMCNVEQARKLFRHFTEEKGLSGVSAKSYVVAMKSVTARWAIIEYRDMGYDVQQVLLPDFGLTSVAKRYERLSAHQVELINQMYAELEDGPVKLAATLIYNLAIRPEDCGMLTKENFPEEDGCHRLAYMPMKTRYSSGVKVDMEIPEALYEQIVELAGERFGSGETLLNSRRTAFDELNRIMREKCEMQDRERWQKCAYELRKLCLDTVLRVQGIEMAVKLSGDRRETIEYYYTDPRKGTEALMMVAPR